MRFILLGMLLVLGLPSTAHATEAVGGILLTDDQYLLGDDIVLNQPVAGDVMALSKSATLGNVSFGGDVSIAGRVLRLEGQVADDAQLLGETIYVNAEIGGDFIAAGRVVTVDEGTQVSGQARVVGERVNLAGHYKKNVQATGKSLYISGIFDGDLHVNSEEAVIQKETTIAGKLIYKGKYAPVIDDRAVIKGGYTHEVPEVFAEVEQAAEATKLGGKVLLLLWPTLAGIFLVIVMRKMANAGLWALRNKFWPSFGLGVLGIIGLPIVAVVLMVSVVGLPFGVSVFASYPVLLLLGTAMGAIFLGARICPWFGGRRESVMTHVQMLLLGILVMGLVVQIPYVGSVLLLIVIISGVGGILQVRLKQVTQKIDMK